MQLKPLKFNAYAQHQLNTSILREKQSYSKNAQEQLHFEALIPVGGVHIPLIDENHFH